MNKERRARKNLRKQGKILQQRIENKIPPAYTVQAGLAHAQGESHKQGES